MSAMTFWTLISENRIEIPIIQRDYTYGRPENKPLAQRFVDTLAESILAPTGNPRQSLNLDFVYGTVVSKNGSNILYPIDGQQRLTTLFLLHFYLAAKESRLAEIGQTLSRFTYETRLNSRDFCNLLVNASISFEQSGGRPRDLIGEYPWYSKRWDRDPTVHSMMEVLDLLHDRLKGSNGKYLDKLLDATSSPITFSFIDLNRESLTDDLYVKMNARGKPLNEFENLKAQIFRHMKDLETRAHFDNQWLDIFWQLSRNSNIEERSVLAEQKFGRFIGNMIINMSAQKGNRWHAETFDIFQAMKDIFSDDSHVNEFRKILDTLSDRETFGMTEEFLTAFAQPDLTYWDRVRFYAVCQFFLAFGPVSDEHQAAFSRWKRVTKNLINNTLIQRPENFRDAITSIKELSAHIENIYEYLASTKVNIRFFVTEQREEESLKAKLIVADPEWESLIHKAESNAYFDGQIGFILAIATEQGRGAI